MNIEKDLQQFRYQIFFEQAAIIHEAKGKAKEFEVDRMIALTRMPYKFWQDRIVPFYKMEIGVNDIALDAEQADS